MADPLSISAGILAVLGAAGKTAQGLEQVYSLKDASKDLLCVINEVAPILPLCFHILIWLGFNNASNSTNG